MRIPICSALGVCLILGACADVMAQPPEPPPTTTLWNFLGIPQAVNKIHGAAINRRGNHPKLEKKPPLKGIPDAANLKSDVPAIKAAAEIKQAEDLAPQKKKALKYLATIGCGCYDKGGKVTKALLAAMEDCTEDVRLEAVRAISVAASGEYCEHCKQRSCCSEAIAEQLSKIAYERDDLGCFLEPSERVRQAAIEALGICCPHAEPIGEMVAPPQIEGAEPAPAVEGTAPRVDAPPPPPVLDSARRVPPAAIDPNAFLREASLAGVPHHMLQPSASLPPAPALPAASNPAPIVPDRAAYLDQTPLTVSDAPNIVEPTLPSSRRTARTKAVQSAQRTSESTSPNATGVVQLIDTQRNLAHIHFPGDSRPLPVGSRLRVLAQQASGWQVTGEMEIVESYPGSATARGLGELNVARLSRDNVVTR